MPLRMLSPQEIQGLDLTPPAASAPAQPGLKVTPIAGTEKSKDPFSEGQRKDAGFALRMTKALDEIEAIEDSGFDPVNFKDAVLVEYAPFIPDLVENFLLSPKYQLYRRAMNDFTTAQLRKETGAQINESEIGFIQRSYVPMPGDSPEVMEAKRRARRDALEAMKANAGKAFDVTMERVSLGEQPKVGPEAAILELRRRAKNDPQLAEELRRRGLME
tara:strand:+ start:3065 stop:3715 length:651 start_codon:yes stop_codon:yes gene_type:complete